MMADAHSFMRDPFRDYDWDLAIRREGIVSEDGSTTTVIEEEHFGIDIPGMPIDESTRTSGIVTSGPDDVTFTDIESQLPDTVDVGSSSFKVVRMPEGFTMVTDTYLGTCTTWPFEVYERVGPACLSAYSEDRHPVKKLLGKRVRFSNQKTFYHNKNVEEVDAPPVYDASIYTFANRVFYENLDDLVLEDDDSYFVMGIDDGVTSESSRHTREDSRWYIMRNRPETPTDIKWQAMLNEGVGTSVYNSYERKDINGVALYSPNALYVRNDYVNIEKDFDYVDPDTGNTEVVTYAIPESVPLEVKLSSAISVGTGECVAIVNKTKEETVFMPVYNEMTMMDEDKDVIVNAKVPVYTWVQNAVYKENVPDTGTTVDVILPLDVVPKNTFKVTMDPQGHEIKKIDPFVVEMTNKVIEDTSNAGVFIKDPISIITLDENSIGVKNMTVVDPNNVNARVIEPLSIKGPCEVVNVEKDDPNNPGSNIREPLLVGFARDELYVQNVIDSGNPKPLVIVPEDGAHIHVEPRSGVEFATTPVTGTVWRVEVTNWPMNMMTGMDGDDKKDKDESEDEESGDDEHSKTSGGDHSDGGGKKRRMRKGDEDNDDDGGGGGSGAGNPAVAGPIGAGAGGAIGAAAALGGVGGVGGVGAAGGAGGVSKVSGIAALGAIGGVGALVGATGGLIYAGASGAFDSDSDRDDDEPGDQCDGEGEFMYGEDSICYDPYTLPETPIQPPLDYPDIGEDADDPKFVAISDGSGNHLEFQNENSSLFLPIGSAWDATTNTYIRPTCMVNQQVLNDQDEPVILPLVTFNANDNVQRSYSLVKGDGNRYYDKAYKEDRTTYGWLVDANQEDPEHNHAPDTRIYRIQESPCDDVVTIAHPVSRKPCIIRATRGGPVLPGSPGIVYMREFITAFDGFFRTLRVNADKPDLRRMMMQMDIPCLFLRIPLYGDSSLSDNNVTDSRGTHNWNLGDYYMDHRFDISIPRNSSIYAVEVYNTHMVVIVLRHPDRVYTYRNEMLVDSTDGQTKNIYRRSVSVPVFRPPYDYVGQAQEKTNYRIACHQLPFEYLNKDFELGFNALLQSDRNYVEGPSDSFYTDDISLVGTTDITSSSISVTKMHQKTEMQYQACYDMSFMAEEFTDYDVGIYVTEEDVALSMGRWS